MHSRFNKLARIVLPVAVFCSVIAVQAAAQTIQLDVLGEYKTGIYDASSAEIVAHDPASQRLFIVRGDAPVMDIISIANPASPMFVANINLAALWPSFGGANSVAVRGGIVAAAVQANPKTDNGRVYFFDASGTYLHHVVVGALPDMITFTEDGSKLLVANEGEPNNAYTVDPEGSVSIIDISAGVGNAVVTTAGFSAYNAQAAALRASGVRIFGPGASVAQDIEPEYITTKGGTAWVSLQENNALAIIDIASASVTAVLPLGTKDHSIVGSGFDASDRDNAINIASWPVKGMYQPDAIGTVTIGENTYLVTANEGDARDYDGFSEEVRMRSANVDAAFPNRAVLRDNAQLGRLNLTSASGDVDGDGDLDELHAFGARSFSIRDASGALIWDSGDDFERIISQVNPAKFNASNDDNNFDSRSDNKGPEPEALALAHLCGRSYAFIGLERIGGIMVYDITNPAAPVFEDYINNRDFSQVPGAATVNTIGDLGPEGLIFIPSAQSPNGQPLLVCASEVSGTVTLFTVRDIEAPALTAELSLVDRINAGKGDFRVDLSATDGCDPAPAVTAVMDIPALVNPTVTFVVEARRKLKFHPAQNSVTVEAPDPAQFWADILAVGGVPVSDGDVFEFDQLASYPKHDFEFGLSGGLVKIKAAVATLTATAVDASNNMTSVTASAMFPAPKESGRTESVDIFLSQNYPNPFNPSTSIRFSLPLAQSVTLFVHDLLGRPVATLMQGTLQAGWHSVEWDGRDANGLSVPSGAYIYTLRTAAGTTSRQMLLTK